MIVLECAAHVAGGKRTTLPPKFLSRLKVLPLSTLATPLQTQRLVPRPLRSLATDNPDSNTLRSLPLAILNNSINTRRNLPCQRPRCSCSLRR